MAKKADRTAYDEPNRRLYAVAAPLR